MSEVIHTVNPATGEPLAGVERTDPGEIGPMLERSERAFAEWRTTPLEVRAGVLRRAAELLRKEKREHAERMAREMGKPVAQGAAEAEKCAWACDYYADEAEGFLAPEPIGTDAARSYVRFDPLGPVLAIMPWNFPYWQVFRFAAPNLMAGNSAILKHASNVPRCARAIEALLVLAGLPEGVFQTVIVPSSEIGAVIESPSIRAVTLTGSERAGARAAERAGRTLKKTVLELGGSDPFIVLDDADVASVAAEAARARTINSGQSCIAAKRFIVAGSLADDFCEAFRAELEGLRIGDPLDEDTEVGPLAREDLLASLHDQVQRSMAEGARLLTGGRRLERAGFFYPPTLLSEVRPGMAVAEEETFGPVAAVLRARSDSEAVELANASRYGLGASVWSRDVERAEGFAPRLEAGHVAVNGIVKSDPRLPFGGVKQSGYGRELARFGIREFVNAKTVWVGPAD